jgi:diguanylate cyclase (GGDEF)-like protein
MVSSITYQGEPAQAAIVRDLTARRQAEAVRQQAEEQLRRWARELQQRNHAMDLLGEMGEMLQAAAAAEQAQAIIAHYAGQLFPDCAGAVYLLRASRNLLEAVVRWGPEPPPERDFTPDACWALRRGRPHRAHQSQASLICPHVHPPAGSPYACLPLTAQGEALGILHLRGPIEPEREPLTNTVAEQAALALLNLRLRETLRNQAIRDPLTGLFNRRFLEETLERELKRAERTGRPVGLLMLDIDHFKRLNDTFGHDAGDYALRELAHHLEASFRAGDVICRYGGEEFTVLLPEASPEHTRQRAEILCAHIRNLALEYRGQPLGSLTVSIGLAAFPIHGESGPSLIQKADAALYQAKRAGRDRVALAASIAGPESPAGTST